MADINEKGAEKYEVVREGKEDILRVDCEVCDYFPSLEESEICMSRTVEKLVENPGISRLIFLQRRRYEYSYEQTQLLVEIAALYNHLLRQKRLLVLGVGNGESRDSERVGMFEHLINLLRSDPISAYVEIKRVLRGERIKAGIYSEEERGSVQEYISLLNYFYELLGRTKLIERVKPYLAGYVVGSRELYNRIFRAVVSPDFMHTKLMARVPVNGEEVDNYRIDKVTDVTIFKVPGKIHYLYHLNPPEFKLSEDKYELLDMARIVLAEHKPREEEFLDPERMRETFSSIGRDMLQELADKRGILLKHNEIKELSNVLVRYTIGFGLIEVLLRDRKIQDIVINSPIGQTPIFIVHEDYDECVTNIIPSREDGISWATKFRLISGRPLDEANPILDTELITPDARARVAVISQPLSPWGLAYAFRRHRDKPWTYPLFIENKMMNNLAAGLLSFFVDGASSIIFAGTRSSGKSSLLNSTLVEVMRKYRILTIEDTLELSTDALRKLGYNIQPMKVRSAIVGGATEIEASEGIRTALRMGDSALIVGEIRSVEARALFESMRIGSLANIVAGTVHGDSPYGVFDRVVNDLQVPRTSFKAVDIIVISNPVRSADGLHKWRRVVSITEVRKDWERDPLREKGFVDLMRYDTKEDRLKPTEELLNGDSEILKRIASQVKDWVGNWEALWDNIILRAKIKEALVYYAKSSNKQELLEAEFTINANDMFHRISDNVKEELGVLDVKEIYSRWEEWLKKEVKNG